MRSRVPADVLAKRRQVKKQWSLFLLAGILAIVLASSLIPAQLPLFRWESSVTTTSAKQWWDPRQANAVGAGGVVEWSFVYFSEELMHDDRRCFSWSLIQTEDKFIEDRGARSDRIEQKFQARSCAAEAFNKTMAGTRGSTLGVDQSRWKGKDAVSGW